MSNDFHNRSTCLLAALLAPAEVGRRVRLVEGEAEAVAGLFAPSSFDVVLCQGVLMHFPDPGPLLDAIAQVVAPGRDRVAASAQL